MHRLGAPPQWWLVVLATTGWSAAYLDGQGALQVVLPALFAVGCASVWRAPVPAAALVGAAQAVGLLAGVPTENPAGLLAGLVCLLVLGSTTGLRRALPVVGLYVAVIAVTGLPALRTAVGVLLFSGTWAVADQLRRRRRRVAVAHTEAARLSAQDPRVVADELVAAERTRLVARSARVVRTTLLEVRRLARLGGESLDPAVLAQVRARAVAGVDELRDLLELVRAVEPPATPTATSTRHHRPAPWLLDLGLALGVLLVGFVDLFVDGRDPAAATVLLGSVLAASLTLRSTSPRLAATVATGVMAAALVSGAVMPHGLAEATVLGVLVWSLVSEGRRTGLLVLVALLVATVAVAQRRDSSYDEVAAALIAMSATTAWVRRRIRDEQELVATRVAALDARTDAVVREALAEGRARVARDLHDVVGHALGVMVVQSGAATMAAADDPVAARRALAHVAGAGDDALAELVALDGGGPGTGSFRQDVAAVVERVRAAGLPLTTEGELDLPSGPVASVLHRVVQESVTNALKHAPGAAIAVVLSLDDGCAAVEVRTAPTPVPVRGPGSRSGLTGLADRVTEVGGTLEAGRLEDGSFRILARVPAAVGAVGMVG